MTHASRVPAVLLVVLSSTFPVRAPAVDFIRGDANGDGGVSISDAQTILSYLFNDRAAPECLSASDADDNGGVDLSDAVRVLNFLLGRDVPSAPFPGIGPDPTSPESPDCASYGSGTPLDDPAARLEILDAAVTVGTRRVEIPIAISSSGPVAGYSGAIVDEDGLLEAGASGTCCAVALQDLTGKYAQGFKATRWEGGRLNFALLFTLTEREEIPPGEDVVVAKLIACVKSGMPAGEYRLTLEGGELAASCLIPTGSCVDSGRAIHPTLGSAVIMVEGPGSAICSTVIEPPPPPPPPLNVRFALEGGSGAPGQTIDVPFTVRADRPSQGFAYSVRFDRDVLEGTGTEKVFVTASATPYEFERFEINNDSGFLVGAAIISLADTAEILPPDQDVTVLEFELRIRTDAEPGDTQLEFMDGGRGTGGAVRNKLVAEGQEITPETASSFVFVNALIAIIPDATPFVRGDSNGDDAVNVSDAQFTLNHLFLGGEEPPCPDAADANDDGRLNIADPIATLLFLFVGNTLLPPPRRPGVDPTPDELISCGRSSA